MVTTVDFKGILVTNPVSTMKFTRVPQVARCPVPPEVGRLTKGESKAFNQRGKVVNAA